MRTAEPFETAGLVGSILSAGKGRYGLKRERLVDGLLSLDRQAEMKTVLVVAALIRDGSRVFATQRGYGPYKDWWEFPGGKIEPGETPEEALKREIREELDTEIKVGDCFTTIEYEYPDFHLSMRCYWAEVLAGGLILREHEAARWLGPEEIDSVNWLPADWTVIGLLKQKLRNDAT